MTSKIFRGDMPEIMEKILNNLNDEFYSLYSCALVSRHWCKISIPILWQDPFSINRDSFSIKQTSLFISQYISSFDENEKLVLKEYGIYENFSETLFDYARFLKVLDLSRLESKVYNWITKLKPYQYYNGPLANLITNLLFKLLIKSGAILHKLVLNLSNFLEIKPEIFNSLEQNDQFFSKLQDLVLNETSKGFRIESATKLLRILAKNATKISDLKLNRFISDCESQLFHVLICIINSQEHLRKFSVSNEESNEFHGIISSLEKQKSSLQEVNIENCAFSAEFEVLKNIKNLEILRVRNCDHPKLLKILNNKISTLEIVNLPIGIDASDLVEVLEKSGILLQRLKLEALGRKILEESLLLESFKFFCPNITYLNISYIFELSTQFLELICTLQKLQFLTLDYIAYIPGEELKILVKQFAEILPSALQYLKITDLIVDKGRSQETFSICRKF
ncbi:hypothetical protein C2G38_2141010 [Gigaspora rosea]|uniref:F-box domain-containing protein n=1 Tax=Gigaspora rosea TaxID=44941 RepID=A0A397VE83_9GLOM|nr:hypothetical protein C2G38_2141010 [Gigaspora rosea]